MTKLEFLKEIEEISGDAPGSIKMDDQLASLALWDSMAYVSFIAMADEKLGMTVDTKSLAACKTIKDLSALFPGELT